MKNEMYCLLTIALLFSTNAYADEFEGPLVIKNGHPLYAALNSPSLVSAEPESTFDVGFSYSSTYLVKANNGWQFGIDLETAILDLQLKRRVGEGVEVGIDLPVIRYDSGFMDDVINDYHSALGMTNAYNRKDRPRNDFLFDVTREGKAVIHGNPNKAALGDVLVEVKNVLWHTDGSIVSVQTFLNLPVGDPESGYGSGGTNGGIAALLNENLFQDLMLYVNVGAVFINTLKAAQNIELNDYYFGGIGLELKFSRRVTLNAQMIIQSSPFPKTGIRRMDDPSLMASIGGRYKLGDKTATGIAVTEDPDTAGAPDFMVAVDCRYGF